MADKSEELNMKKITIAIDGFSSCGKSTMAKDLAREVGYIYIDSGAMYRAVTLYRKRHFRRERYRHGKAEKRNQKHPYFIPPESGDRTAGHVPQRCKCGEQNPDDGGVV